MRENRTCGSEGGEAQSLPYPYRPEALLSAGRSFDEVKYLIHGGVFGIEFLVKR